jgi:hypothetical protein
MRRELIPQLLAVGCIALAMLAAASTCEAGILLPEQVTFNENDLERALENGGRNLAAGLAPRDTSCSSSSTPIRRINRDWWNENERDENRPFELANYHNSPTGSSSSSTSTSSGGGAPGSGAVVCLLSGTLNLRDDSPLGHLAEDHGLSLPDPPGTDLLRPPRIS